MKTNFIKVKSFIQENSIFILIFIVGISLRSLRPLELFMFSHDQDVASWIVKDILYDKNIRLIGQQTSVSGVYIGGLWYYALIPFYLLTGMDPAGTLLLPIILGAASIFSMYFVIKPILGKTVSLISTLIYSVSFLTVMTDREVVPTTPVMLWSIWFIYSLHSILEGRKRGLYIAAFLFGLIWHINLALALLVPVAIAATLLSSKKYQVKVVIQAVILATVVNLPFFVFEVRNGFAQTRSILMSSSQESSTDFLGKLTTTLSVFSKNIVGIIADTSILNISPYQVLGLVVLLGIFAYKSIIPKRLGTLFIVWFGIYLVFFSRNKIILSEYYLNSMNPIWVVTISLLLSILLKNRFLLSKQLGFVILAAFTLFHINKFFNFSVNASGYIERKAVVTEIALDAKRHNYPCVSISYMTDPGFNLGYRYLIFREGLHANLPKSNSPVYTIVFPHSKVGRLDKSFGALGLVYPDYERYKNEDVEKSCLGENDNLTEPLVGFVK